MKIALATCDVHPQLPPAEQPLLRLLREKGYDVSVEIWDNPAVNWSQYKVVLIRTIWDYYKKSESFAKWLDTIDQAGVNCWNSTTTIRHNMHKFYLRDMEAKGVKVIPTHFIEKGDLLDLSFVEKSKWKKMIIKPAISAGSYLTEVFEREQWQTIQEKYKEIAKCTDLLVQRYMPEIKKHGELSFLYFNNKFSHAVLKKPKRGDFRVQVQYGGIYTSVQPSEALLRKAEQILAHFPDKLLYARVDGIAIGDDYHLMEVELIEPDLYLAFSEEATERFVRAFCALAPH